MKTFIEIGSCDFGTLNHFTKNGTWRGIIVDPIKRYLDNIPRANNIEYVNVAISNTHGIEKMYVFNDDIVDGDKDFAGMSTMHPISANLGLMHKVIVNTLTYKDLLELYKIERVDYLKIDTEGHDMNILKEVIFEGSLRPELIKIEHKHCNLNKMSEFLLNKGYHIDLQKDDIFALNLR